MYNLLYSPPSVFALALIAVSAAMYLAGKLSFRRGEKSPEGSVKPYACGEDDYCSAVRPDYSSFFRFAFFFTLAHVAGLIITTVPAMDGGIFFTALIYIEAVIVGLFILFRN